MLKQDKAVVSFYCDFLQNVNMYSVFGAPYITRRKIPFVMMRCGPVHLFQNFCAIKSVRLSNNLNAVVLLIFSRMAIHMKKVNFRTIFVDNSIIYNHYANVYPLWEKCKKSILLIFGLAYFFNTFRIGGNFWNIICNSLLKRCTNFQLYIGIWIWY